MNEEEIDASGRVPAIILAAGASSRLGRPKQLEVADPDVPHPERLLERAVRLAREAGCEPVIVVLGAASDLILAGCSLGSAQVVINPEWFRGMSASLRAGLQALAPDARGALVLACDQPSVSAQHLRRLWERGMLSSSVVASAYAGRRGVPAWFPAAVFRSLEQLEGDTGARALLGEADALELRRGELDVDTEASLQETRAFLRGGRNDGEAG